VGVKKPRLKKRLVIVALAFGVFAIYFFFIHKPASAELRELQRQEKALSLPKPWQRDSSDSGCKYVRNKQEKKCYRHIDIVYKNTAIKSKIEHSLDISGWSHHKDSETNFNSLDFDKAQPIHFDSWDLYVKDSPQGKLCAVVDVESNANYKKDGPWALALTLFGNTERCDLHAK
jgi:hypothetical protein